MNIKAKAMTALAAATLATAPAAQARTVAWYHFNEGASGARPTNAQPVFVNAADPGSLDAIPRVRRSWSTVMEFVDNSATYLPVYTNDFPSCVSWFDPSTGARGEDRRCLWMHTAYNYGHGDAPIVLVDDNEKLHCANITAECMVKLTVPSGSKLSYQSHMLIMRNSPTSETTANVKAWGMIINANGTVRVEMQTRDSTGLAADTSKNLSFVTPTSSPSVTDGKWHHVAFTYDGATVRIYVDYVEYASQAWSEPIDYNENLQGRLNIAGLDVSNYGGHWYGFIDEVRISDAALPPEKFLHVGGLANNASDQDTAIYLPFNSFETSSDTFFGAIQNGNPVLLNSACSTNAGLIDLKLSTITAGILPRLDAGASAVVSDTLHAGVFATNSVANEGCWTYTNNLAYSGKARYITVDDYSKNNNTHLITSGDFTAELYLKLMGRPTTTTRLLCENSGAGGAGTLDLRIDSSGLKCTVISQAELDKVELGEASSAQSITLSTSVDGMLDGAWHHVALVVDRTRQTVTLYLDRNPVATQDNFVLASKVSTKSDSYKTLKLGDGWGGNNAYGFHNMSIDEYRITRRALAPQEFLMTGAAPASGALDPTRMWIGFEGDLNVKPDEGAIPEGASTATTVTMEYSSLVPGIRLIDGNGNLIRASNASSLRFSGAYGSGEASPDTASQRLFFSRNILLERDMKSMTVEFFMRGAKNEAKAWATILRMYGNATGNDNSPFRRLWSVGYSNTAGNLYVIKDVNGATQSTFYPSNTVSFADGKWHHIAVTFAPDGNGNTLCNVYKDYQQLGSEHTFTGEMECGDYDTSSFAVGSRYNGYLDEIRVSKGVLTVNEMLHAQPRGTVLHLR